MCLDTVAGLDGNAVALKTQAVMGMVDELLLRRWLAEVRDLCL